MVRLLKFHVVVATLVVLGGRLVGDDPLRPRSGWKAERLLSAPELAHPSVVCTAPDGRIFVAEDPMDIRSKRADAREGRILCRHADGRLTVYAEGLHAVFGMQYLEGRLYVLHNPRFSVFADRGDHGEPLDDLIHSTNPEPWALDWNDHVPANFRLGLDGYFYVATGDKGLFQARGSDGRELSMRGGVFRIRPDGTGLEAFSHGVRNILDVARTDEDDLFTYDNTDEHQWMSRIAHMVDGGFYGWPHEFIPRRDHALWCLADLGGGAATGALVDDGGAWPPELAGQLYLADFGKRQVLRVRLERDGATFRLAEREDLIPDPPADFRPVGLCQTADGTGLLVCDWQHRDSKAPVTVGRLWLLTPDGARAPERPGWWVDAASGRPFTASEEALLAALDHPSRAVRDTAQRELSRRPSAGPALQSTLKNEAAPWRARIHALWALTAAGEAGPDGLTTVVAAVASPDARVARQALRALGERAAAPAPPEVLKAVEDPDPTRRFRAATALGRIADPRAIPALRERLGDADDWVRFAAFTAINRIGRRHGETWDLVVPGLADPNPRVRSGTRHALRETWEMPLVMALAKHAGSGGAEAAEAVALLGALHRQPPPWQGEWWAYHPANSAPPARTGRWAGTAVAEEALLNALQSPSEPVRSAALLAVGDARVEAAADLLEALAGETTDASERRAVVRARSRLGDDRARHFFAAELLRTPDPEVQVLALDVLRQSPAAPDVETALVAFWRTQPREPAVLIAACRATGDAGGRSLIPAVAACSAHPDPGVRSAAVSALGRLGTPLAVAALERTVRTGPPDTVRSALTALGGVPSREARAVLFAAAVDERWRGDAIGALARRPQPDAIALYLDGLELPEAQIREQCRAALGQLRDAAWPVVSSRLDGLSSAAQAQLRLIFAGHPPAQTSGLYGPDSGWSEADYLAAAGQSGGNELRGRDLFFSPQGPACSRCHRVGSEGSELGPDLTHAGTQFDRMALAEAILFPSQSVREGYQQTTLELASGDVVHGLMRVEEADAVTVRDAGGQDHRVPRTDIRERLTSGQSLMPEGLAAGLSPTDWADLLAYLESLR